MPWSLRPEASMARWRSSVPSRFCWGMLGSLGGLGVVCSLRVALSRNCWVNTVTYIELVQGCRNKQELARIKKGLAMCSTEAISNKAMELIEQYALSHSLQLGDVLIAATALEHQLPVLTANAKHFSASQRSQLNVSIRMPERASCC